MKQKKKNKKKTLRPTEACATPALSSIAWHKELLTNRNAIAFVCSAVVSFLIVGSPFEGPQR